MSCYYLVILLLLRLRLLEVFWSCEDFEAVAAKSVELFPLLFNAPRVRSEHIGVVLSMGIGLSP